MNKRRATMKGASLMEAVVALTLMGMMVGIVLTAQSFYFAYRQSHQSLTTCQTMLEDFIDGYRTTSEIVFHKLSPRLVYEDRFCRLEILSISDDAPPVITLKLSQKGTYNLSRTIVIDFQIMR